MTRHDYLLTRLPLLLLLLLLTVPVHALNKFEGYVERGGVRAVINMTGARANFQGSYPGATVTVYNAGTVTLSTIYSDSTGSTALANPFTASTVAYYEFYSSSNCHDIKFSGGGLSASYTLSNVCVAGSEWEVFDITEYGCVGDDSTDNRACIKAAWDAADAATPGGIVHVPDGTFLVSTFETAQTVFDIGGSTNVRMSGNGESSVIKMSASFDTTSTNDPELFKALTVDGGASNITFRDLKFDMNGPNNLASGSAQLGGAIRIDSGDDITIDNVWFTNTALQRYASFGAAGTRVTDLTVRNCRFDGYYDVADGNTSASDHSSLYVEANRAQIHSNTFFHASAVATTATAIEIHGIYIQSYDNLITQYRIGTLVSSLYANSTDIIVGPGNSMIGVSQFVSLDTDASLYSLNRIRIVGNHMVTASNDNTAANLPAGYGLIDLGQTVDVASGTIDITGNYLGSVAAAPVASTEAIGVILGNWERITITGNTFEDLTNRGISMHTTKVPAAGVLHLTITGNEFIDVSNTTGATASYYYAVQISTANAIAQLRAHDNTFINDTRSLMTRGISGTATLTRASFRNNRGNLAIIDTWQGGTVSTKEYTPPITLPLYTANGNLVQSTTTEADVPGLTTGSITYPYDLTAIVHVTLDIERTSGSTDIFVAYLDVNTVNRAEFMVVNVPSGTRVSVSKTWRVDIDAGVAVELKVQGDLLSATSDSYTVYGGGGADHSNMIVELVPRY